MADQPDHHIVAASPLPSDMQSTGFTEKHACAPEHGLWGATESWAEIDRQAALRICDDLNKELSKLKKKVSSKRVHDTRVALRRWKIAWTVLAADGWETHSLKTTVLKPLKRLRKKLGDVREFEVDIKLAKQVGCDKALLADLKSKRKQAKNKVKEVIAKLDVDQLVKEIHDQFDKQLTRLEDHATQDRGGWPQSAYDHFDQLINAKEKEVFLRANTAVSGAELHQWRIGVKEWRYLLAEFMRVSSPGLVEAQDLLGKIHDIDAFEPILASHPQTPAVLSRISAKRQGYMRGVDALKAKMPYGLRPHVSDLSASQAAASQHAG